MAPPGWECLGNSELEDSELYGALPARAYSADDLLRDAIRNEAEDLELLRGTFRELHRNLDLVSGKNSQLVITGIGVYHELAKVPNRSWRQRKSTDGAVGLHRQNRFLAFSARGIKDSWVRYEMLGHCLERPTAPGATGLPDGARVEATMALLVEMWHPGDPAARFRWHRILCDRELMRGFQGSRYYDKLKSDKRRELDRKLRALEEQQKCRLLYGERGSCKCWRNLPPPA